MNNGPTPSGKENLVLPPGVTANLMDPYLPSGAQFRTVGPRRGAPGRNGPQCYSENVNKAQVIMRCINAGHKVLVIMRGLPGSGKTTMAKKLQACDDMILSTDKMFTDRTGEYSFDREKLEEAHRQNLQLAILAMESQRTPIVIDNTNIEQWEMQKYVKPGVNRGYEIYFLEPDTPWAWNVKECALRNSHGVPLKSIKRMQGNYQKCSVASFFQNTARKSVSQPVMAVANEKLAADEASSDEYHSASPDIIEMEQNLQDIASSEKIGSVVVTPAWDQIDPVAWGLPTAEPLPQRRAKSDSPAAGAIQNTENLSNSPETTTTPGQDEIEITGKYLESQLKCASEPRITKGSPNSATNRRKPKPSALGNALLNLDAWKLPGFMNTADNQNTTDAPGTSKQKNETQPATFSLLPEKPQIVKLHERQTQVCDQLLLLTSGGHRRMEVEDQAEILSEREKSDPTRRDNLERKHSEVQCDLEQEEELMPYEILPDDQKLCQLFKGILPDHTSHILSQADGNLRMAVDVLLDCGFLYCLEETGLKRRLSEIAPHPEEQENNNNQDIENNSNADLGFDELSGDSANDNEEYDDGIVMELGPKLAKYLEDLFGPVDKDGMPSDIMPPEMLRVRLPMDLAAQMHSYWVETIQRPVKDAQFKSGFEAYAYARPARLSNSENTHSDAALAQMLQEVQDEAIAKAMSNSDFMYDSSHFPQLQSNTMASKAKLGILRQSFPSFDHNVLQEIFEQNKYNFEYTKKTLIEMGHKEVASSSATPVQFSLRSTMEETVYEEEEEDFDSMKYDDVRKKAINFSVQKRLNFDKAGKYYKAGNKGAASYYSGLGHEFHDKEKKANARVAAFLIKKRDCEASLDLHGFHVSEAQAVLSTFLRKHDRPVAKRNGSGGKQLKVVTGQGKHSLNGPKIKPAVVGLLKQWGYRFEEQSAGILKVWAK